MINKKIIIIKKIKYYNNIISFVLKLYAKNKWNNNQVA